MSLKPRIRAVTGSLLPGASIPAGVYTPINPTGLPEACFYVKVINASSAEFFISYDYPVNTNHAFLQSGGTLEVNAGTLENSNVGLKKGTVVAVYYGGAPAVGTVYLSGYYLAPEGS